MRLEITRLYQTPISEPQQTEGEMYVIDDEKIVYDCKCLELPWRDNQFRVSCIPSGTYLVIKHQSPKFGDTFWVKDVPNRTAILIHSGNYNHHTLGCILPGRKHTDINSDGIRDVVSSGDTMDDLWAVLPDEFELVIRWR